MPRWATGRRTSTILITIRIELKFDFTSSSPVPPPQEALEERKARESGCS